jgi:hypothetical protein
MRRLVLLGLFLFPTFSWGGTLMQWLDHCRNQDFVDAELRIVLFRGLDGSELKTLRHMLLWSQSVCLYESLDAQFGQDFDMRERETSATARSVGNQISLFQGVQRADMAWVLTHDPCRQAARFGQRDRCERDARVNAINLSSFLNVLDLFMIQWERTSTGTLRQLEDRNLKALQSQILSDQIRPGP